ncbi:MAG: GH92 family glycosyl hydrolase, partial [Gammaproteobacteria bacterium]
MVPHRVSNMMRSLLNDREQGGWLPKWALANGYTGVMGGDAADTIIAGAWAFGARAFDTHAALAAMVKGATDIHSPRGQGWYVERPGLDSYLRDGYVDDNLLTSVAPVPNGASETLEYASDDFSIAAFAGQLGEHRIHDTLLQHSMNWANLFDTATGLITTRNREGAFLDAPITDSGQSGFQEGNAAQYTWMVPQDLRDLIQGMGGRAATLKRLDTFFSQLNAGQSAPYAWLGNEPSFGAPWVYLSVGAPWRTQSIVRQAITTLYGPTPDGIPGNDDLGAMSSWYLWSAMGLYPQNPALRMLDIGSPLFPRITVHAPGGPTIEIRAPQASLHTPYVHALKINGNSVQHTWIELPMQGDLRMDFTLGDTPDMHWGTAADDAPPSYAAGPVHFPPTTSARITYPTRQYALQAGAVTTLSFDVTGDAGKQPISIHWHAVAPAGLSLHPDSGAIELRDGKAVPTPMTLSADRDIAAGYYDIPLHAQTATGAMLPTLNLIARVTRIGQRAQLLYVENYVDDTVTPIDSVTHAVGPAIRVGRHPAEAVISPDGTRVYVSNPGSDSVSVIDTDTQEVIASIDKLGPVPDALAISAD